jgi:biopolymer transport protein ExbD
VYINAQGFVVKTAGLGDKTMAMANGVYPFEELHKHLLNIKTKRPNAKEITLIPSDDITYDVMVQVMDASREVKSGEAGYQAVPPDIAQKPESDQFNRLFPEVSIGGV